MMCIGWCFEVLVWDIYLVWYKVKGIDWVLDVVGELLQCIGLMMLVYNVVCINMQCCFFEVELMEIEWLLWGMWDNFGCLGGEMLYLGVFVGDEFNE